MFKLLNSRGGTDATGHQTNGFTRPRDRSNEARLTYVRVLVIGYGNTLRGDDGFGVAAAEHLREMLQSDFVRILTCQQLTPELANEMSKVDRVIMIDAARGDRPGLITVTRVEPEGDLTTFTHELRPSTLLACSQGLYGSSPETFLVSVTGYSFDFSDKLSDTMTRIMRDVLIRVRELVDQES